MISSFNLRRGSSIISYFGLFCYGPFSVVGRKYRFSWTILDIGFFFVAVTNASFLCIYKAIYGKDSRVAQELEDL